MDLFTRSLEIEKNTALQQNNGNYEATMTLSLESVSVTLAGGSASLPTACKNITMGNPAIEMATDASTLGWGEGQSAMDKVPKACGSHLKNKTTLMDLNYWQYILVWNLFCFYWKGSMCA